MRKWSLIAALVAFDGLAMLFLAAAIARVEQRLLAISGLIFAASGFCAALSIWSKNNPPMRGVRAAFILVSIMGCLGALIWAPIEEVRYAACNAKSMSNLKHIGEAMRGYHECYGELPPAAVLAGDGKPLLSWRVALLPFLLEGDLYRQFHLDEPWDSPHNQRLLSSMPANYASPGPNRGGQFETFYQVLIGPGTAFERDGLCFEADFPDGVDETILVVEAAKAVPWTKPEDVSFDDQPLLPRLGGRSRGGFVTNHSLHEDFVLLFGNGATRKGRPDMSEETLRAWVTRNGCKRVRKD